MRACVALLLGLQLATGSSAAAPATVARVRAEGRLHCGVVATPEDWNKTDLHGPLSAFDAEFCRAVAVAAGGVRTSADVRAFASELEAEEALSRGIVDLAVGVTPTATSTWQWNIAFGPVIFYDGLGILVRGDSKVAAVSELAGMKVCVIEGTDNEQELLARTVARGIAINPLPFQEEGEMDDGLAVRHCDAVAAYRSRLAQLQRAYPKQLANDRVLPELLTLAPVAVAYRPGDPQWQRVVDWTVHALIQAEASGVTRGNVTTQKGSEDPLVQRLLGIDWATSRALGLPARDWAAQVIMTVGNYGEIYERTVGGHGALNLPRGLNALWSDGGLLHPLPVQ